MVKLFTYYWLDGKKDSIKAKTPEEGLMLLGYSGGAVRALDFYDERNADEYIWKDNRWINKTMMEKYNFKY